MDVVIILCWCIWMVRNDLFSEVFNLPDKNATARTYFTKNLLWLFCEQRRICWMLCLHG
ncbi:hypothetical protein HU200_025355 [Digitaria exilis]|uniref:Uncharacterized protein n=1 Tax=Digitaria exilis TaxID=1010633 RepID=A0A835C2Z1_9POAL|nr:hypothetical protein HU200_025355 [Digitaria exilis]